VASVSKRIDGEVLALDGKTLRGSYDRDGEVLQSSGSSQEPLHLVSAWASEQRLVLAQETVEDKTNEITVLPDLLEVLEVEGCLVTIDAMGTQREIAEQITGRGGEYVLALKSNHPRLYGDVTSFFEDAVDRGLPGMDLSASVRQVDGGHGRVEVRRCWVTDDIDWLDRRDRWAGLQSLAMVEAQRSENRWDEDGSERIWARTTQRRYYISSLPADARRIAQAVRSHWGIENSVHWVLDVSFREDASRIRKGEGPKNVGVLRRIAMNLVRQDERPGSLRQKRKRAGWDDAYREEILGI
jgi:predicted transposase YbfD/YdcC